MTPLKKRTLPDKRTTQCKTRSTLIDFAKNQLCPSLISLSPLTTAHPSILQHTQVQSFKADSDPFDLATVRSLGFGFN